MSLLVLYYPPSQSATLLISQTTLLNCCWRLECLSNYSCYPIAICLYYCWDNKVIQVSSEEIKQGAINWIARDNESLLIP